ncbi:MAG: chromosomal replication initiator protein DnaA, partial [Deltaproteobacteria bacterium]
QTRSRTGRNGGPPPASTRRTSGFFVNPYYTFDTFVVGPCNEFAYTAAHAITTNLNKEFNPFVIYGPSGNGKTHLIQAVCNEILKQNSSLHIYYDCCESFINHFISALEKKEIERFRNMYRKTDILLVDDIHLLANKQRTQEEFFHTFNALFNCGKQIVLTSDSIPSDIPTLQERLSSRFNWGMVAQISPPDFETRCAILQSKARFRGVEVPDDVIKYLAENIKNNIRELEGAITKVSGYATLMGCELNLATAQEAMKDVIKKTTAAVVTLDKIVQIITLRYPVKLADLQSKKRYQSITEPRQAAMYMAKRLTNHSLQEIGGYFGGRDHTTVLHACNKVSMKMKEDDKYRAEMEYLMDAIMR